ncbi:US2 protein [Gallid alphaherpesvirus 3]|uniref:US2 protein n=2 Tax=Gallid alphaherpesvirus 3 TaxID=35250 RepID=Q782M7_9ALPH|nr:virion protein US2 [Gallid alphaherpesvirus 3]YP_010795686.1 US2 protein [Gallid alphaherpesvirus 3]BAA32009.1 US2 [Marek's disease virus serotype 2 MDV2]AEI00297.1 US2 protein [Gallid alphaherpesvirus 3]QEY02266.1 US2 protein [Gallid alphaherpesvirus 3]BAB16588.1 US2 protein [Gallid alphaherpesvirus 3]
MGVSMITVVTLLDECERLPGRSRDAASALWIFLIKQCMEQIHDDVGVSVVVRSADLFRFSRPLLVLPRRQRPIIRTNPPDGTGIRGTGLAGTRDSFIVRLFEDVGGCASEWQDVMSGYLMLESDVSENTSYSLWIVGAADLCRAALEYIPLPKRLLAVKVAGTWSGMPWALPDTIPTLLTSTWEPTFETAEDKEHFRDNGMTCVYKIIGSPPDPPKPPRTEPSRASSRSDKVFCCWPCCKKQEDQVSIPICYGNTKQDKKKCAKAAVITSE